LAIMQPMTPWARPKAGARKLNFAAANGDRDPSEERAEQQGCRYAEPRQQNGKAG